MSKKKTAPATAGPPAVKPADQAEEQDSVSPAPDSVVEIGNAMRAQQVRRHANRPPEGDED